jgi:hypothetical protein
MNYAQLIEHFETPSAAAHAIGVSRQLVNYWKKGIPAKQQLQIQILTKGALQADAEALALAKSYAEILAA